jgi:glutamate/tyrosine decarboxylase-like PLP-dependent enzyme
VADPLADPREPASTLELAVAGAQAYLGGLGDRPVRTAATEDTARRFIGPLPEDGIGGPEAIRRLVAGLEGAHASAGPRFFHFVTGGVTPAALGADWLASTVDQNAFSWASSPLATQVEDTSVRWLLDLFGLPAEWGGVLTTGATMANFTALAAARTWWAGEHGVDVDADGLAGLPPVPLLTGGHIHPSATKALSMLGVGRDRIRRLASGPAGDADLDELAAALADLKGAPAIIVANAGEVNAGIFDPVERIADLAARHHAWLHVDGAFGLFARLSPAAAALAVGVERADSVIADGHKWLNVPYDCGFAFVRDRSLLVRAFGVSAAYLPQLDAGRPPDFGYLGPELSRRARSFAVWATLAAYGRAGYVAMIERHLGLAQRLASAVQAAPELELLVEPKLNIVCFRCAPPDYPGDVDDLNARVGAAVIADGRVAFGTTTYCGVTAFRPAICNWRTTEADVDLIVEVVRELVAREAATV